MPKQPTAEQIADARATLALAATKGADAPRAALIALVTMPELTPVLVALRKAQTLNPADADVSYTIAMIERLRVLHTPA